MLIVIVILSVMVKKFESLVFVIFLCTVFNLFSSINNSLFVK